MQASTTYKLNDTRLKLLVSSFLFVLSRQSSRSFIACQARRTPGPYNADPTGVKPYTTGGPLPKDLVVGLCV